ncbi:MAG: low molecular weight phosphatase family protein [Jeotgalicoccus sp.]|nr:low molecular weight phosphatase family protein [Jeotgalicoccus sp.]
MNKIIFVCTGNTCRSPLAESYARMKYPHMDISSRGLYVTSSETSSKSLSIIEKAGLPVPSKPEQLTRDDTENSMLLVMGDSHKSIIQEHFPEAEVKLISEYAEGGAENIPDPYGGNARQYENVFMHLKKYIDKFNL